MMKKSDPTLAPLQLRRDGDKNRPFLFATQDFGEDILRFARGDHERNAGAHDDLGGFDLGPHAADGGFAGGSPGYGLNLGVDLFDDGNRFGIGFAEIFNDAVDGGQDDEQVGRQKG